MILLGQVDPVLSNHLRKAISSHSRWCRENGITLPTELGRLLTALADTDGQTRPKLPPRDETSDDDPVRLLTLDYDTAADRLMVSARTIRRLVAAGTLPAVDVAGCRRIRTTDLTAYIATLKETA